YFEAEIMADESDIENAKSRLEKEIAKLGLKSADEEEYYDLLNSINSREGGRIDLEKSDISEIRQKYYDYFN
ncbi:MAG TPA: hypothetical protein PK263_02430, partial [bacterium]|nr:hypothetical protein [bacterium]